MCRSNDVLWLDYETYSEAPIKKTGADVYSRDPSTQALMLGWAINDGPAQLWNIDAGEPLPRDLEPFLLGNEGIIRAHNAPFEIAITEQVLKKVVFNPIIDLNQWQCSQVLAFGLSFTGSLEAITTAIGFTEDSKKSKDGKKLIQHFCTPDSRTNRKTGIKTKTRRLPADHPEKWERFKEYCVQDVVVLRDLWNWCEKYKPMSEEEWDLWRIDRIINRRGIPVDTDLVDIVVGTLGSEKVRLTKELVKLTGLSSVTPIPLRQWFNYYGLNLPNLQKETKQKALKTAVGKPQEAMELSLLIAQTSSASKWNAFDLRTDKESGVLRETLQFAGASRTRRWAGRGVQLQNLKRTVKETDANIEHILSGAPASMDQITTSIRGAIAAPEGKLLVVSDLSSIESRLAGWVAGCKRIIQTFDNGRDTYKDLATEIFNIPYDQVTKGQRSFAKPAALGCQYMLGAVGLSRYAENYGVDLPEEVAGVHVKTYRRIYPEIPAFWDWIKRAVFHVTRGGDPATGYGLHIYLYGGFLFITLPSGRKLSYFKPRIRTGAAPWDPEKTIEKFTFMGVNAYTTKWERIDAHAGGILENVIQAIARDVLAVWIQRVHDLGGEIVLHVHDEIVLVVDENKAEGALKALNDIAAQPIPWAPGLNLSADGYISKRYRKD